LEAQFPLHEAEIDRLKQLSPKSAGSIKDAVFSAISVDSATIWW
jgi:hypothetical protein